MAETILLGTLDEYSKELRRHLDALRERHGELDKAWVRLREIYEGEGARVFAEVFEAASARLRDYNTHGAEVTRQLEAKIEELRRFEASGE